MTDDRARIATLEAAVAELRAQQDPQAQRDASEYTWDPRGLADVLLVQDSTGAPLTRRKTIQFTGTVADDPAGKRTVVDTAAVPFVLSGARAAMAAGSYSPSTMGSGSGDTYIVPIPALTLTVTVPAGPAVPVMFAAHLRYAPTTGTNEFFAVLLDPVAAGSGLVSATSTLGSAVRFGAPGAANRHVFTAPPGTASVSSGAQALSSGLAIVVADNTATAFPLGNAVALPVLVPAGVHVLALGLSCDQAITVRDGYVWAQ